jgi:hypothetical protein
MINKAAYIEAVIGNGINIELHESLIDKSSGSIKL